MKHKTSFLTDKKKKEEKEEDQYISIERLYHRRIPHKIFIIDPIGA